MWLASDFQFHFLQHKIDIMFYSYSCICFNSVHGIQRSVPVDLCEFFTLVFQTGDSSFAAHCFAIRLDRSFRSRVCSSDSLLSCACVKKNCSSSATSEEEVVTSIGVVWISSLILRCIFCVTLSSSLERKSAAVLTDQVMCSMLKLNCNT